MIGIRILLIKYGFRIVKIIFHFFFKQNSVTEKSQRYGSETVPGSGRQDHVDLSSLQERMKTVDKTVKEEFKEKNPTRGYGGKYGTEQVMDKVNYYFIHN